MPEMMSPEQATAFNKSMKMLFDALGHVDNPNPNREAAMVAVNDQFRTYEKEFDTKVRIALEEKKAL